MKISYLLLTFLSCTLNIELLPKPQSIKNKHMLANTGWSYDTTLTESNVSSYEGNSVALSTDGTTLAVSAWLNGAINVVQVYGKSGSTWEYQATLTIKDSDQQSVALSSDGNTLAAGDPNYKGIGATVIYVRSGSTWNYQALLIQGQYSGEGNSVALSADGNTLAVGAPLLNGSEGATYIYVRSSSQWKHQATLTQKLENSLEGSSVALSANGNILAVGAPSLNSPYSNSVGVTQIYTRNWPIWNYQAELAQEVPSCQEGYSVALSADGTVLAAGAPLLDDAGGILIYVSPGYGQYWQFNGTLTQKIPHSLEGASVAVASHGNTFIAGAPRFGNYTGATHVYAKSMDSWKYVTSLTQNKEKSQEGAAVALANGTIAAGAPAFNNTGATQIYFAS